MAQLLVVPFPTPRDVADALGVTHAEFSAAFSFEEKADLAFTLASQWMDELPFEPGVTKIARPPQELIDRPRGLSDCMGLAMKAKRKGSALR